MNVTTGKVYSVADACRMAGWDANVSKYYHRVHGACGTGAAGAVLRANRGFVLTRANVRRLIAYLKARWPDG
jgi:hypothetical protein